MPCLWLKFKQQRGRTRISGSSFRLFRLAIIALANLIQTWRSTHWCSVSSVMTRYVEGVVTRGHQLVIPKSLQEPVISICHEGHLGNVKTKQLPRSRIWFPGIDKSVERRIASCIPCQASTNSSQREPLRMSPTPKGPWLQVSADFCGPFPTGETVLVVLDTYSKYPEAEIVSSVAAKDIIPALERIFATHGIPEVLKTDNGPPFKGHAFQFAKEKGFTHRKVTPTCPEANGHVEGFMKNLGKVARTAYSQGKDWRRELYVFSANYRATPHQSTGKSPYQLCMNRTVRIKLPTIMETTPDTEATQKDKDSKAKMKAYADQKRQVKLHNLNAGDTTLVKQRRLNKASPHFEPVPYTVLDVKGSMITARRTTDQKEVTRNSSHFKKLPNLPGSTLPETEPVPADELVPIPSPISAHQEESSQAQPSDTW